MWKVHSFNSRQFWKSLFLFNITLHHYMWSGETDWRHHVIQSGPQPQLPEWEDETRGGTHPLGSQHRGVHVCRLCVSAGQPANFCRSDKSILLLKTLLPQHLLQQIIQNKYTNKTSSAMVFTLVRSQITDAMHSSGIRDATKGYIQGLRINYVSDVNIHPLLINGWLFRISCKNWRCT